MKLANADQLKALDSIVGKSHIHIFLSPEDMTTAEYVSKMLGAVVEYGCRKPLRTLYYQQFSPEVSLNFTFC